MRVKRKIPAFIFGVTVGLLIGIAFFIFKIDDYFKKIRTTTAEKMKIIEQPVSPEKEKKKEEKSAKPKFKINTNKSPDLNYSEIDRMLKDDESIHVAKEELISVKNVKVINLDNDVKDTLTGQLAGVSSNDFSNVFFIEFWKTPLNSKGYRMTRNRVILYGLEDFSGVTIYKADDNYYLKSQDQVYKLSVGTEFKPMERVVDQSLLARIN